MPRAAAVRPAEPADAAAIAALLVEGSLTPEAEEPGAPQRYEEAVERIRANHGEVLVAVVDGTVVGVCEVMVLEHVQHAGGRVAELESVHVATAMRGRGIGAALLDAAIEIARDRGCYRVQLTSNARRDRAHRFYEARGFVASHVGFKLALDGDARAESRSVARGGAPMRGPAVPPRIIPLPDAERSDVQRELLARIEVAGSGGEANIFTTLVRAPEVFRQWLRFGGALLRGTLPARDRELVILRTAVNCDAPYEWGQHARLAGLAGLSEDEVRRVADGPDAAGWDDGDRLLLGVADELHRTCTLDDARFGALAARYDDAQLIELVMVVGHYHLVAMTLNALGVPLDEGLEAMPD